MKGVQHLITIEILADAAQRVYFIRRDVLPFPITTIALKQSIVSFLLLNFNPFNPECNKQTDKLINGLVLVVNKEISDIIL